MGMLIDLLEEKNKNFKITLLKKTLNGAFVHCFWELKEHLYPEMANDANKWSSLLKVRES